MRANVSASASAAALGSIPAARSSAPSSTFTPRTYSMVSTFPVVSDQWMSGVTIRGVVGERSGRFARSLPSHVKSSSRASLSLNSGTRKEKSKLGKATSTAPVMKRMVARSTSNCRRSPVAARGRRLPPRRGHRAVYLRERRGRRRVRGRTTRNSSSVSG